LLKLLLRLLFFAAFLVPVNLLTAQELIPTDIIRWYRSNAAGMALEPIPSRLAALRNEYSLSVETVNHIELPESLVPYYDDSYKVELRILYEEGSEFRRQWIFRDNRNFARLVASAGFIEIRDWEGSIVRELRFEEDNSQWDHRFFYEGNILLKAETWFTEENEEEAGPLIVSTDYYRYSRSGSLRAIDRIFHEGAEKHSDRFSFPRIGPDISPGGEFGTLTTVYIPEFLYDVIKLEGLQLSYTLDSRGRILREVWKDDEGLVLGEYLNTWSDDRLLSVLWKSDDDERLVEYEYDDEGNRIVERNYRRSVLERSVTSRDGRDTEEIYMDGHLILRALWENGLKISEERIPSARGERNQ